MDFEVLEETLKHIGRLHDQDGPIGKKTTVEVLDLFSEIMYDYRKREESRKYGFEWHAGNAEW